MYKTGLIIGATSAIAQSCAHIWCQKKQLQTIILVSRDTDKLDVLKSDFHVRYPELKVITYDLNDFTQESEIAELMKNLDDTCIDIALIAQGMLSDQAQSQNNFALLHQLVEVNAVSVVLFAEAIVARMNQTKQSQLGIISSVAGDRARKRNYHYGATKAFISFVAAGLQHRLAGSNISVSLIKPGPTTTPMTVALHDRHLASVSQVANDIVSGMAKKKRIIYTPNKWRYIMALIKQLPWYIYKRIDI